MDVGSTGNACLRTKNFASHSRSFKVVKNYTDEYGECKFLLVNYCRPKYGPLMQYSTSSIGVTLKSRLGVEIMRDIGRKTLFFIPPCTVFNLDEPLKSLRISAQNFNTNCPKPWAIRWSKYCWKVEPCEQGARTLQTADENGFLLYPRVFTIHLRQLPLTSSRELYSVDSSYTLQYWQQLV